MGDVDVPIEAKQVTHLPDHVRPGSDGSASYGLLVALVIVALVGLILVVPGESRTRLDVDRLLRSFLEQGPSDGRWRVETLSGVRDWVFVTHPQERRCVVVATAEEDASGCCRPRASLRRRVASWAVPGDPDLFFQNYRVAERAEAWDAERRPLIRVRWVAREDRGGESGRLVWVDRADRRIVRLEDRSYEGGVVRSLTHLSADSGGLEPPPLHSDEMISCVRAAAATPRERDVSAVALARATELRILEPRILPPGFELIDAEVKVLPIPGAPDTPPTNVELAFLVYSDGFALISLGMATASDLDAFEEAVQRMGTPQEDPEACPTLPQTVPSVQAKGLTIRRRKDRCRTVLRVDGLHGVSVSLLGRNELPEDDYLEVIESLVGVRPPPND